MTNENHSINPKSYKKQGFTLAEVLITLGIIGVVAAMTIPTLLNEINDKELKTAWKREYSVINQAFMSLKNDRGGRIQQSDFANSTEFKDAFKSYLSTNIDCAGGSSQGICWNNFGGYKKNDGQLFSTTTWWFGTNSGLALNDGKMLLFNYNTSGYNCSGAENLNGECARIYVDVNGAKKPNTWGKDIYWIMVYPDKLLPFGSPTINRDITGYECSSQGQACSSDYLMQ